MKQTVLGLFFLCFLYRCPAQPVDSLRQALTLAGQDTFRVKLLLKLAKAYQRSDTTLTLLYARQARELSQRLHFPYGVAMAHVKTGDAYLFSNSYRPALTHFKAALAIAQQEHDSDLISLIYNDLGLLYADLGDYPKALRYFFSSLPVLEKKRATQQIGTRYLNIAMAYGMATDYDRSIAYLTKALTLANQHRDTAIAIRVYINLANVYKEKHEGVRALVNARQALLLGQRTRQEDLLPVVNLTISSILIDLNRYDDASRLLTETLPAFRALNDQKGVVLSLINQARVHSVRHQLEAADHALSEAVQLAKTTGLLTEEADAYQVWYGIDTLRQNYRQAIRHRDQASGLKDSLLALKRQRNLDALHIDYQTRQQEQQIAHLQREGQINTRLFYLSAGSGAVCLLLLLIVLYNHRLKQRLFVQRIKLLHEEQQRVALTSQLTEETNARMQEEIEHQNRELATSVLYLNQRNELLSTLKQKVERLETDRLNGSAKEVRLLIEQNLTLDHSWDKFKLHFERVHPQFFNNLVRHAPDLSPNELRHCAYLRMNLSHKEVASLLGVNPDSVKMSRYRIKKKLSLGPEDDLNAFILHV